MTIQEAIGGARKKAWTWTEYIHSDERVPPKSCCDIYIFKNIILMRFKLSRTEYVLSVSYFRNTFSIFHIVRYFHFIYLICLRSPLFVNC